MDASFSLHCMDDSRTTQEDLPPFVDAAWLKAHRTNVVTADVRWYLDGASGRAAYDGGHLPGALFVDLDSWLSGSSGPRGLNPLPDPEVFAQGMSSLGIGDSTTVVAYDDAGGVIAARLVWMLRALGHRAALLDGGIAAWTEALETTPAKPTPATFTPSPWPKEHLAQLEDIKAGAAGIIVDARNADRFDGSLQLPTDPQAGHIPGAVNVPCRGNLDPDGRLRPITEVRRAFAKVGIEDATAVISYCGSGVTACHNLLALEYAGFGRGRLYPGGWSEYGAEARRAELG
ncbi:sulfurtransferase [Arthrobacter sp. StoSoilA2]|nr:sulfurtransferase [Arthrobacter sp. StoSoilA2]BCW52129.1 sulfurtransferase [Arthrobacter sp. StoSoilB13]